MPQPYKTLSSREIYKNDWLRLREDAVVKPDGENGSFAVVEVRSGSCVLAMDDQSFVWLVREFKYAMGRWSFEAPGGGTDAAESPIETARRELREECGLTAAKWYALASIDPLTTMMTCTNHLFLATELTVKDQQLEATEVLDVVRMPLAEAAQMVIDGRITHAATVALVLKVHHLLASGTLEDFVVR